MFCLLTVTSQSLDGAERVKELEAFILSQGTSWYLGQDEAWWTRLSILQRCAVFKPSNFKKAFKKEKQINTLQNTVIPIH